MSDNNKPAPPETSSTPVGFAVAVLMGLAGLATAGLIVYQIARAFFSLAFGVELPNLFP